MTMKEFFSGIGVILSLELRQRVRGTAWYVLLGVFVALVAIVTVLLTIALNGFAKDSNAGGGIFSTIIFFVLLLGTLVAPALSGNAINGDRDAGTLATTQITLITTWQLVLGKFLAAWITALAFLGAAVPFLVYSAIIGQLSFGVIGISVVILAFELGVVAAIGVGFSGILNRPLISIVVTYLALAALSVGTLIAFALGGIALQTPVKSVYYAAATYDDTTGIGLNCGPAQVTVSNQPRFDLFWGALVANPYVILADAVPGEFDKDGYPTDLFASTKTGVRSAQITPESVTTYDECKVNDQFDNRTPRDIVNSTTPGWFVGVIIHIVLASGALVWAWSRTRTPAGKLSRGSRIA
jgi:ABC-2 type transport system permease protein